MLRHRCKTPFLLDIRFLVRCTEIDQARSTGGGSFMPTAACDQPTLCLMYLMSRFVVADGHAFGPAVQSHGSTVAHLWPCGAAATFALPGVFGRSCTAGTIGLNLPALRCDTGAAPPHPACLHRSIGDRDPQADFDADLLVGLLALRRCNGAAHDIPDAGGTGLA